MKAIALAVSFLACAGFAQADPGQKESSSAAVAQSSQPWAWPDYRKDFVKIKETEPVLMQVSNKNPKYKRLTAYLLQVGVAETWLDNKEKLEIGVVEYSVLGNDSVVRMWMIKTPVGIIPVSFQMKVKDKWVDVDVTAPRFYLKDDEDYLEAGRLSGVWVMMNPLDKKATPVAVWVENKEKN